MAARSQHARVGVRIQETHDLRWKSKVEFDPRHGLQVWNSLDGSCLVHLLEVRPIAFPLRSCDCLQFRRCCQMSGHAERHCGGEGGRKGEGGDYTTKVGFDEIVVVFGGLARHPTPGIVRLAIQIVVITAQWYLSTNGFQFELTLRCFMKCRKCYQCTY